MSLVTSPGTVYRGPACMEGGIKRKRAGCKVLLTFGRIWLWPDWSDLNVHAISKFFYEMWHGKIHCIATVKFSEVNYEDRR
jgi:hypothetical protein